MERVRKAFSYADKESSGRLTKHQYKVAMIAAFGYRPDSLEIEQVFHRYYPCETITLQDFEFFSRKKASVSKMNLAEIFIAHMDKDLQCYLTAEDFRAACESSDLRIDFAVFARIFRELDRFKRGHVGIEEFISLLEVVSLGK